MIQTENPALLVIDVQRAIDHFSPYPRNNPAAEQRIAELLQEWRSRGRPIFHIRHSSRSVQSPYHAANRHFLFKTEVEPLAGETIVTKRENCAFIGTDLDAQLRAQAIGELVVTGVVTNHSVAATVMAGAGLDYRILLAEDATATFALPLKTGGTIDAEQLHQIFLSNLDGEYATVCSSADILGSGV